MTGLCHRIRAIAGQTLYTTSRREPFELVAVDGDVVRIKLGNRERRYAINCNQFDEAERQGLVRGDVMPRELDLNGIARGRTAYAAAIPRAVSNH